MKEIISLCRYPCLVYARTRLYSNSLRADSTRVRNLGLKTKPSFGKKVRFTKYCVNLDPLLGSVKSVNILTLKCETVKRDGTTLKLMFHVLLTKNTN